MATIQLGSCFDPHTKAQPSWDASGIVQGRGALIVQFKQLLGNVRFGFWIQFQLLTHSYSFQKQEREP
jgi:hypothetical protein